MRIWVGRQIKLLKTMGPFCTNHQYKQQKMVILQETAHITQILILTQHKKYSYFQKTKHKSNIPN